MFRFRVLFLTAALSFLVLGLRVGNILRDGSFLISEATAQQENKPGEESKPAEGKAADAAKAEEEGKPDHGGAKAEGKADVAAAMKKGADEQQGKHNFTPAELEILQSLSKRRETLDKWDKELELKENLLQATEKRLNEKINELNALKEELRTLVAQYNQAEDAKIRSLVRIYENMKPKDAGRVFQEMDMPILLQIVDKMSEKKAAPILASMTPERAKELTVELAEQRRFNDEKMGSIAGKMNAPTPGMPTAPAGAASDANAGATATDTPSAAAASPAPGGASTASSPTLPVPGLTNAAPDNTPSSPAAPAAPSAPAAPAAPAAPSAPGKT
jgi:flagellar motility protein MotE (MotC chaperone)